LIDLTRIKSSDFVALYQTYSTASDNGELFVFKSQDGEEIFVNGKQMVPDKKPRTVAKWVGGIEELERRRYITDTGHKGQSFKVTKEGYEAADSLNAE
jgi:hypothetical protein